MIVRIENRTAEAVTEGDVITLAVVAEAGKAIVGSLRLKFVIDPAMFEIVEVVPGKLGDWKPVLNTSEQAKGALHIGGYSIHGITGTFVPFTLRLRIRKIDGFVLGGSVEECFTHMAQRIPATLVPFTIEAA